MAKRKQTGKSVNSIKGEAPKNPSITVNPGNIPVLTVQILDAINRNLITIIQQNAKLLEKKDG